MAPSDSNAVPELPTFAAGHMTVRSAHEQLAPLLDRQAEASTIQELRAWCRERLQLRPGDTVVDVGSGTGEELGQLAALVQPGGVAVGIDANEPLLEIARERLGHLPGIRLEVADASDLTSVVADDSVCAVVCERVVQHLQYDPVLAFTEFARVLAPGGTLAVTDTDWSSVRVTVDGDPHASDFLTSLVPRILTPTGGDRLAGLHLEDYCRAAGLHVHDHRVGTLALPSEMLTAARENPALLDRTRFSPAEIDRIGHILSRPGLQLGVTVDLHAVIARREAEEIDR